MLHFKDRDFRNYFEKGKEKGFRFLNYQKDLRHILTFLSSVESKKDLESRDISGNKRCHQLKADRCGQYGMRLTPNYRVVFTFSPLDEIKVRDLEITDYHEKKVRRE
jgi:plasmid maintenance system killer protein